MLMEECVWLKSKKKSEKCVSIIKMKNKMNFRNVLATVVSRIKYTANRDDTLKI